jgi:hypothetical protein
MWRSGMQECRQAGMQECPGSKCDFLQSREIADVGASNAYYGVTRFYLPPIIPLLVSYHLPKSF